MVTRRGSCFLFAVLLILLVTSCRQHYWQRNKVRLRHKNEKPSIEVRIRNRIPYIFDVSFARELKAVCEKEFERNGYTMQVKDTPDYVAYINIDMDSFPVTGVYVFGMGGPSSMWKPYRKEKVYAILFDYRIVGSRGVKWQERNDIYFFDNIQRNSRRSKNMVKYTIRYGM